MSVNRHPRTAFCANIAGILHFINQKIALKSHLIYSITIVGLTTLSSTTCCHFGFKRDLIAFEKEDFAVKGKILQYNEN